MLKIMRESGAYLLSFGLESYSKSVLDSMKKHITPLQINNMVYLMRINKLGLQGSFIFGDVSETCDTAKETLKFLKYKRHLIGTGVSSVFIVPFQGTPIYKQCVKDGKIKDELQFIKDRELTGYDHLKPMNLTDLPEEKFLKLKDEVLGTLLASDCYTTAIDKWNDKNGNVFVKVRCPSCGEISVVKNVPVPNGSMLQNIGCRHCFFRFDLASKSYFIWRFMYKVLGFGTMAKLRNFKNTTLSRFKNKLFSSTGRI